MWPKSAGATQGAAASPPWREPGRNAVADRAQTTPTPRECHDEAEAVLRRPREGPHGHTGCARPMEDSALPLTGEAAPRRPRPAGYSGRLRAPWLPRQQLLPLQGRTCIKKRRHCAVWEDSSFNKRQIWPWRRRSSVITAHNNLVV